MSKFPTIQQAENQFIIRFPADIADQLNQFFEGKIDIPPDIKITPYIQHLENYTQKVSFKINVNGQQMKGNLIQLPTITQTFKTIDRVNFFKSNDINEMILVQDEKEEVPATFARKVRDHNGSIRYKSHSGITPPTKNIKQRFWKKKTHLPVEEVRKIEAELYSLRQDLPFLIRGQEFQMSDSKKKKKIGKSLNQTI